MSMETEYFVIAGYDLTGKETEAFEDWRWTAAGDSYCCNQRVGYVQLFEDPACGNHLFLGYILACGDQFHMPTTKLDSENINDTAYTPVSAELLNLVYKHKVIDESALHQPQFQIIIFEEAR